MTDEQKLVRMLPNVARLGAKDVNKALLNLVHLSEHGKRAKKEGFFLEAISARLYFLDLMLRALVVEHTGRDIDPDGQLTFGRLVERAADCHLPEELLTRLREFNRARNSAIHGLLRGRVAYADLASVFSEDPDLSQDVIQWVADQMPLVPEPLDSPTNGHDRSAST